MFRIENAKCIKKREKSMLVEAPEFDGPEWIPDSQVDDDSEVYKLGDEGTLIVSDWLAQQRGWD